MTNNLLDSEAFAGRIAGAATASRTGASGHSVDQRTDCFRRFIRSAISGHRDGLGVTGHNQGPRIGALMSLCP